MIPVVLLIVLTILLATWAIIDIVQKNKEKMWILIVILLPVFGSILYFQFSQRQLKSKSKT